MERFTVSSPQPSASSRRCRFLDREPSPGALWTTDLTGSAIAIAIASVVVVVNDGVTASWLTAGADTGGAFEAVREPGSAADGRVDEGAFPTARDDGLFWTDTAVRRSVDADACASLVLEAGTAVTPAPPTPVDSAAAACATRLFSAFLGASTCALRFFDDAVS